MNVVTVKSGNKWWSFSTPEEFDDGEIARMELHGIHVGSLVHTEELDRRLGQRIHRAFKEAKT